MIPFRLDQVVAATRGSLVTGGPADLVVDGPVVTDSRLCGPGGLYVARRGEQADGHDYVAAARQAGAVAALVERAVDDPLPQVLVGDAQEAFGRLARATVDAAGEALTVVAVTGSSGKTSTKDLLATLLAGLGPTVAAEQSFNSEIGVPLTVCRIDEDTRYLVAEMGARGAGHLSYLTSIAPPAVSVVLNVGHAHASEFGSLEGVATAKAELVQALGPEGVAVLNLDDPRVAAMAAAAPGLVLFTSAAGAPEAAVRAEDVRLDEQGRPSFRLVSSVAGAEGSAAVRLALHGEHHVSNALSAAAVALRLGLLPERVADLLSTAVAASRWRMEVTHRSDGVTVVNDAYNANPDSVRAALKALASMGQGRRTWAVLGEMLELGDESASLHDEIGRLAVRLDISQLVVVGDGARPMHTGAVMEGSWGGESVWVPDTEAAYELLAERLEPGDVALFKSSRDSGLRWLGDRVAADTPEAAAQGSADSGDGADTLGSVNAQRPGCPEPSAPSGPPEDDGRGAAR